MVGTHPQSAWRVVWALIQLSRERAPPIPASHVQQAPTIQSKGLEMCLHVGFAPKVPTHQCRRQSPSTRVWRVLKASCLVQAAHTRPIALNSVPPVQARTKQKNVRTVLQGHTSRRTLWLNVNNARQAAHPTMVQSSVCVCRDLAGREQGASNV